MLLQTRQPPESLTKWNSPAGVFSLAKFKSPSRSPKSLFSFEDAEESDDEGSDGHFSHVPKGYFAVYVGWELQRYVIPLSHLNHSIFKALLKKAEEEFGFSSNGGIRIPCESLLFEHILWLLKNNDPMIHSLEVEELLGFYHDENACKSS